MSNSLNDLDKRKQKILISIIETYIKTNEPVGSKIIVSLLENAVSSATVRNDMAELVSLGYLEQPHTSAGRIPTAKAFRLYIDEWMPKKGISKSDKAHIDETLDKSVGDPDRVVASAAEALADLTGYAALSMTPQAKFDTIRQIEVLRVSSRVIALLIMTESGLIRSKVHRFECDIDNETVALLDKALSKNFIGSRLGEINLPKIQSLIVELKENALTCAPALISFEQLVSGLSQSDISLKGQLNLLSFPDYDVLHAKSLLEFLSKQDLLSDVFSAFTSFPIGLRVVFGDEFRRPELDGSSIVAAKYSVNERDDVIGSIGIIGPLRMDYSATISRLEYIADIIEELLSF